MSFAMTDTPSLQRTFSSLTSCSHSPCFVSGYRSINDKWPGPPWGFWGKKLAPSTFPGNAPQGGCLGWLHEREREREANWLFLGSLPGTGPVRGGGPPGMQMSGLSCLAVIMMPLGWGQAQLSTALLAASEIYLEISLHFVQLIFNREMQTRHCAWAESAPHPASIRGMKCLINQRQEAIVQQPHTAGSSLISLVHNSSLWEFLSYFSPQNKRDREAAFQALLQTQQNSPQLVTQTLAQNQLLWAAGLGRGGLPPPWCQWQVVNPDQ